MCSSGAEPEPESDDADPARFSYGPFHRLASPTQTPSDTTTQLATSELWGLPPRFGVHPQVKAYRGPLPAGADGIEFYTAVRPEAGTGSRVLWYRFGVRVEDGYAKIAVRIVRVVEDGEPREPGSPMAPFPQR